MQPEVHPQITTVRELFAAILTLVWLHTHVTQQVRLQLGRAREGVSALLTPAVPPRLVGVGVALVLLHGVHVGELFPAGRALEEVFRTPRHTYTRFVQEAMHSIQEHSMVYR